MAAVSGIHAFAKSATSTSCLPEAHFGITEVLLLDVLIKCTVRDGSRQRRARTSFLVEANTRRTPSRAQYCLTSNSTLLVCNVSDGVGFATLS